MKGCNGMNTIADILLISLEGSVLLALVDFCRPKQSVVHGIRTQFDLLLISNKFRNGLY